jgi:hypothetical protein
MHFTLVLFIVCVMIVCVIMIFTCYHIPIYSKHSENVLGLPKRYRFINWVVWFIFYAAAIVGIIAAAIEFYALM